MTRSQLKQLAKDQIRGKVGTLFVMGLVIYAISFGLNLIPVVGSIATVIITPAFTLAYCGVYLSMAGNPEYKPAVGDIFSGLNNVWSAFKVYFLQGLFVFLWSLLFVIPGIIKGFAYSQAFYILAENPEIGAREALNRSSEMMNGHKMDYFILTLSFIGWALLSSLTCGLLFIWVGPYMNATFTNFYNSIKPATEQTYINDAQFN